MFINHHHTILVLPAIIQLATAIPAPSEDTPEDARPQYHARPSTDTDHLPGSLTTHPQQGPTYEGAATITVTITRGSLGIPPLDEGSLSILPFNPGPTDLADVEGSLSILPFDGTSSDGAGPRPTGHHTTHSLTGHLDQLAEGINTRTPPAAIASLSGQPPAMVSQASSSALRSINDGYHENLSRQDRSASEMVTSMMSAVSSMSHAASISARDQRARQLQEWNYWCQTYIREGMGIYRDGEGGEVETGSMPLLTAS